MWNVLKENTAYSCAVKHLDLFTFAVLFLNERAIKRQTEIETERDSLTKLSTSLIHCDCFHIRFQKSFFAREPKSTRQVFFQRKSVFSLKVRLGEI